MTDFDSLDVPSDEGKQGERTVLSWTRTSLALVGVGSVQLRGINSLSDPASLPGIALVMLGLVYMVWSGLDYFRGTLVTAEQDRTPLWVVGVSVALFSALTAVAVLVGRVH